jgi:copper chaperone
MSCEHCVKAVTKATTALDSVKGVKVDLKAGTVSLEYDPAKTPLASIKAAIEEEGYEIK